MTMRVVRTASPAPLVRFSPSASPSITFVYVTFGTGPIIETSLRALAASIDAEAIDAEVIVVDNRHPARGHRCGDRIALMSSGVTLVLPDENLGFGGGNEMGAAWTRSPVLCFINPDVIVPTAWVRPLLHRLADEPGSIVAPVLLNPDGSLQEAGQRILADGRTGPVLHDGAGSDVVECDYASAACWLVERSLHERIGGFDPTYHPAYFEDVDYALRVRRLGGRTVVVNDVAVVHHHRGSVSGPKSSIRAQYDLFFDRWSAVLGLRNRAQIKTPSSR